MIRSYVGPFVLTFFISTFLLLMQFLWKYIDDLIGKGLDGMVIAELMLYASASLVPLALPLSVLLSSIMTMGNLGQNNELMALKAAGNSLIRIMYPMMVFIGLVSVGAFFFANNVMPYTNLKMGSLLHDVRKQKPEVSIKEGIFSNSLEGYSIKVSQKNKKTGMLYNLLIYDHTEERGNVKVTIADSATMRLSGNSQYMILTMYQGHSYTEAEEKQRNRKDKEYPHERESFSEERILIDMSGLGFERTDEKLFKSHYQMLNLSQLDYAIDSLNKKYNTRRESFVKNLKSSNYFKRIAAGEKDSLWSLNDQVPETQLSIDSLYAAMSVSQKRSTIDYAKNYARSAKSLVTSSHTDLNFRETWINKHEIEWQRKFTMAVSCLVLFFVGAPFGAIVRKGGLGMPIVISVIFFVVYYVISISGEKAARLSNISPFWGMWMGIVLLMPLGLFLTYKAATDSVILDVNTYLKPLKKFFKLSKKLKAKMQNQQKS